MSNWPLIPIRNWVAKTISDAAISTLGTVLSQGSVVRLAPIWLDKVEQAIVDLFTGGRSLVRTAFDGTGGLPVAAPANGELPTRYVTIGLVSADTPVLIDLWQRTGTTWTRVYSTVDGQEIVHNARWVLPVGLTPGYWTSDDTTKDVFREVHGKTYDRISFDFRSAGVGTWTEATAPGSGGWHRDQVQLSVGNGHVIAAGSLIGTFLSVNRCLTSGLAHTIGDWTASSSWGTTGGIQSVVGKDGCGVIEMKAGGTGIAANPTVTLTAFKDGAWVNAPIGTAGLVFTDDGGMSGSAIATATTTGMTITLFGLPLDGKTYKIYWKLQG